VNTLDVSPFPPKAKDTVTITATGSVDKQILSGNYELVVKLGAIKLVDQKGDLCTFSPSFTCPHDAGSLSLGDSLTLPAILPKGKYKITLSASDDAGLLMCFEVELDLAILLGSKPSYADEFADFVKTYEKQYDTKDEMVKRFGIFIDNLDTINKHNSMNLSWKMGVNEYADLTYEEFRVGRFGYNGMRNLGGVRVSSSGLYTLPDSVDWTTKNDVTAVKNQEQCGSCWAFSTTGSTESAVAIKTGKLNSLSEQQLVDCSSSYGNMGCNGGLMDYAFKYIIGNGGLCSEQDYPYTATDGTCKSSSCSSVSSISSYQDVAQDSEDALQAAVASQPVSVAIEADQSGFQLYSSGIFTGSCGTSLDHGVLAVGYGTDNGQAYWKVKNSWGASWGMSGYILMGRNMQAPYGQCGIAMEPSYPIA
jgi:C1A family cysteine protease